MADQLNKDEEELLQVCTLSLDRLNTHLRYDCASVRFVGCILACICASSLEPASSTDSEGGGTAFGVDFEGVGAGAGDGAGDAEVDAAGVGLELAEGPPSLAKRFKRICVAPVSTSRYLRG